MTFHLEEVKKVALKNPILIEGLPGIGNVGKIATDFMIENLKAKKLASISSHSFPHAVFVNEDNLIELPLIEVYHKKIHGQDYLFLSGDIQPVDEESCYGFCDVILDYLEKRKVKEIITLGGIGLSDIPKNPNVYSTANTKSILKKYKHKNIKSNIYGIVGPIVGVSGLLIGLSQKRNIPGMAILAETFGHPNYLGIKGAREILKVLDSQHKLGLDLKELTKEIKALEKDLKLKGKGLDNLKKLSDHIKKEGKDINYIG